MATRTGEVETIRFMDGENELRAVVGPPLDKAPNRDAMKVEAGGVTYAISISLGSIPDFPGVGFIARAVPVEYTEQVRNTVRGESDESLAYLLRTTVKGTIARTEVEAEIARRTEPLRDAPVALRSNEL